MISKAQEFYEKFFEHRDCFHLVFSNVKLRESLHLPNVEWLLLQLRFIDRRTYAWIGKEVGKSGERIRQILLKAIRKLNHPSRRPKWLEAAPMSDREVEAAPLLGTEPGPTVEQLWHEAKSADKKAKLQRRENERSQQ